MNSKFNIQHSPKNRDCKKHEALPNTRYPILNTQYSLPDTRYSLPTILILITLLTLLPPQNSVAQITSPEISLGLMGNINSGSSTPFWLRTNRDGVVRWNGPQTIAQLRLRGEEDDLFGTRLKFEYGADLVGRYFEDNSLFLNQGWGELSYGPLYLYGGRKAKTVGVIHERLSSGSMGISRNASPMPKIEAGLSDYITIPFTFDAIEIRGHIAHGWFEQARYVENPWLHEKSGYLRFGRNHSRFSVYGGLSHFGRWGGTSPDHGELPTGFRNFWRIFFVVGADGEDENVPPGWEAYMFGGSTGIWDFGATFEHDRYTLLLYRHVPIEDKDGLKLSSPQDGLWGIALDRKETGLLIQGIAYEFIYTKWQNGPDGPGSRASGRGGWDNYYNNGVYRSGWTYRMQSLGSPLLNPHRGPLDSERYRIINNRVVGHHVGMDGFIGPVHYRTFLTYTRNYGTYWDRERSENFQFEGGPEQLSALVDLSINNLPADQMTLNLSLAFDYGQMYNNSAGILAGIKYQL